MKRLLAVLLVGVAPLGATLIAQEKPNFVGTWKLSAPASADMFTPTQITVVQDATDLIVTTTGQMGEFKTPYKLDGSESRNPLDFQGAMIDRMTKMAWDGNKLVLTATSDMNGQAFEVKSIWTLTPDGTLSTANNAASRNENQPNSRHQFDNVFTYSKSALGGTTSRPHLSHARRVAVARARRLAVLMARAANE